MFILARTADPKVPVSSCSRVQTTHAAPSSSSMVSIGRDGSSKFARTDLPDRALAAVSVAVGDEVAASEVVSAVAEVDSEVVVAALEAVLLVAEEVDTEVAAAAVEAAVDSKRLL